MKIELVPSTVGQQAARQYCIAALVNDTIAVDAGTIGLLWPFERQQQIRHVFLSHSHVDHIASLPLFLDNIYQPNSDCPNVYACEATEQCLRRDVFNDRLWPDFIRLSEEEFPFLNLQTLQAEVAVELSDLTVTPVPLNHVVPTMGFILQDQDVAVAFVSDTNQTERVWDILSNTPNLSAVFLECSFPDSHRWLADKSGHLCPELFEQYLGRLPDSVSVVAWHLKPCFFDDIVREIEAIGDRRTVIGVPGKEYVF